MEYWARERDQGRGHETYQDRILPTHDRPQYKYGSQTQCLHVKIELTDRVIYLV